MLFLQPSSKCLLPTEARLTSLTFQSTLPLVTSSTSGPLLVVFGVLVKNAGSFGHFSTSFLALTYFLCFIDLQCVSISNWPERLMLMSLGQYTQNAWSSNFCNTLALFSFWSGAQWARFDDDAILNVLQTFTRCMLGTRNQNDYTPPFQNRRKHLYIFAVVGFFMFRNFFPVSVIFVISFFSRNNYGKIIRVNRSAK